jgi:hypothetical protein
MVNQLLGVRSDSEVNEIAQLFSDFVDGCLSIPINLKGFAYHTAMKVTYQNTCVSTLYRSYVLLYKLSLSLSQYIYILIIHLYMSVMFVDSSENFLFFLFKKVYFIFSSLESDIRPYKFNKLYN